MRKVLLLLCVLLCSAAGYSQSGLLRKEADKNGSIIFAEFMTDSASMSMGESRQLLRQLHALEQDEDFLLTESKTDELGFTHHYFNQYYKGIRVAYSSYSVHGKDNIVHTVNGTYNKFRNVNTAAKISEVDALEYATKFVNASVYKWEVPEEERWLKENYNELYYPKGELVIVKDRLKSNNEFRLAWKFDVYAHMPLSRNLIYVDAISGDILDTESKIHHVNSPGTSATRYSGARDIISDSFVGGFRLRETRNSVRIETYNMRNQGTNYGGATDFVDNDNNWTAVEFNNANMDNAALDAHWGSEMVYDYFNTVHNRNSWNGSGGPLLNYVHTNLVAFGFANDVNAFWDGQRMTYGDGNFCFQPLTSIDIVAHEIGHGINSSSARIKYEGESGALNESLSDIWAACVEFWAAPEKQTWLLGEDITQCDNAFRSMGNPNAFGQPDTYQTNQNQAVPFWFNTEGCNPTQNNDHCGVHTNSGVPNFWFFLLVNGGTGTNDIGNCYNVTGIAINQAARIVYRAETVILASSNEQFVTFNQFRNATITAASNLYGANSAQRAAVINAWFAVGVGGEYIYTSNDIAGQSVVCTSDTQFTLNNIPAGSTVTWTATPTNLFAESSGDGVTSALSAANSSTIGQGTLTFTVNRACGNPITVQRTIWVGKPGATSNTLIYPSGLRETNPVNLNTGAIYQFRCDPVGGFPTSWTWLLPTGFSFYSGSTTSTPYIQTSFSNGTYTMYCRVNNNCGFSYTNSLTINIGSGGGGTPLRVRSDAVDSDSEQAISTEIELNSVPYPNPVSEVLNIKVDEISSLALLDVNGQKLFLTTADGKINISVANLPNGVYILSISNSKGFVRHKILVQH